MAEFTRQLFLQALDEWGGYAAAFNALSAEARASFLNEQGYETVRDLLAHVGAWWEEGRGIIGDAAAGRKRASREYDFDEFNASAISRWKAASDSEFFAWYESQRKELEAAVTALTETQLKIPRVQSWLDAVILEHLKEHSVIAPRFLAIDILEREWAEALGRYNSLGEEQQTAFLQKQGFPRVRDLVAHIIAWWEQVLCVIEAEGDERTCEPEDADAFNAEAVERFAKLEEPGVYAEYEKTRLTLLNLIGALPEELLSLPTVQEWIRSDVLAHYYDHVIR
jgi:hypothetical protein